VQPGRALRMTRAREVLEKRGVGREQHRHRASLGRGVQPDQRLATSTVSRR
jgi:hypothetical protein